MISCSTSSNNCLLSDLYSTLDGKPPHNKLLLQHLIATPIQLNIFFNFPAQRTFIIRDSPGFFLCVNTVQLRNTVLCLL